MSEQELSSAAKLRSHVYFPTETAQLPHIRMFAVAGAIAPNDWLTLAKLAREFADGQVYLLSKSMVELRDVREVDEVVQQLAATSLHRCTCNVLVHPLSEKSRKVAIELAKHLPKSLPAELTVSVIDTDFTMESSLADVEVVLTPGVQSETFSENEALPEQVVVRHRGQLVRALLADVPRVISNLLSTKPSAGTPYAAGTHPVRVPIGWLADHLLEGQVELGAGIADGVLAADLAELLGRMDVPMSITPWGGLVIHGLSVGDAEIVVRVLAPRGFIFDANSPLLTHHG